MPIYNVVVTGSPGVGKSSLIARLLEKKFQNRVSSTTGVDTHFYKYFANGNHICVHIFDTCGHQRFQPVLKEYYEGADGIVAVHEVNSKESLEFTKILINDILKNPKCKNTQLILACNKVDTILRKSEIGEVDRFAYKSGIDSFQISAKSNVGVNEMFHTLFKKLDNQESSNTYCL